MRGQASEFTQVGQTCELQSCVARAGRTVRPRSQASLVTVLREEPLSLGDIGFVLSGRGLGDEFGNIRRSLLDHRYCEVCVIPFEPRRTPILNRTTAIMALI